MSERISEKDPWKGRPRRGWHNLKHAIKRFKIADNQPHLPGLEPRSEQPFLGEMAVQATVNGFQPIKEDLEELLELEKGSSWAATLAAASAEKY